MASTETPARDAVLVKFLNEAYGKEKQLETSLQALIARATPTHKTLKKGLQDHLRVTKNQARELQKRIRALGGKAEAGPDLPGPDALTEAGSKVTSAANKALAAAKGPVQMLRGTSEADNMLRNVRDAFWNEAEEIGHYSVIEQVATKLNDRETVALAKRFRKEEERFQSFLERQIKTLVGQVVQEEVPARERRNGASPSRRRSSGASARSTSSNGASSTRKAAAQKAASTRTRKAAASSAKSTAKSARTTAKKAGTTARRAGSAARSTAKRARS